MAIVQDFYSSWLDNGPSYWITHFSIDNEASRLERQNDRFTLQGQLVASLSGREAARQVVTGVATWSVAHCTLCHAAGTLYCQ